jgi:predicted methyltransferase
MPLLRFVLVFLVLALVDKTTIAADLPGYGHVPPSRDGTGIVYLGRETAAVMGHEAADWLERPERFAEERPDLLLQALALKPGMQVADIGAGTGYYSWRMAEKVGPTGRVYAVDVQPEMLDRLAVEVKRHGVSNVKAVLGATDDPRLPSQGLDTVLMVDVYHEFDHPREMLAGIVRSLKDDGVVVFVEYRAEDPDVPIKPHHKMSVAQVRREAEAAGLVWDRTIETLPWQHIVIFRHGPHR